LNAKLNFSPLHRSLPVVALVLSLLGFILLVLAVEPIRYTHPLFSIPLFECSLLPAFLGGFFAFCAWRSLVGRIAIAVTVCFFIFGAYTAFRWQRHITQPQPQLEQPGL
jgi:hypothetical protein